MQKRKEKRQMSETVRLGVLLALAGGFMDAYSYLCRGEVFANAQTGNMLLLGVHLAQGDFSRAFRYVCPVLAFTVGIVLSDVIRHFLDAGKLHWRQISVLVEALFLFCVGFLPQAQNLLANSLTSLACGMQVESFRKIHGNGIATTMCIGNLRSGTQNMCDFLLRGQRAALKKGLLYYGIILCFIAGAVAGGAAVVRLGERAVWLCAGILMVAFLFMFVEEVFSTSGVER